MDRTDLSRRRTAQRAHAAAGDLPQWLRGRRALLLIAAAAILTGVALNWGWLTAVGVAPVLIALAPCALMCAAGLCMASRTGKSSSEASTAISVQDRADGEVSR